MRRASKVKMPRTNPAYLDTGGQEFWGIGFDVTDVLEEACRESGKLKTKSVKPNCKQAPVIPYERQMDNA